MRRLARPLALLLALSHAAPLFAAPPPAPAIASPAAVTKQYKLGVRLQAAGKVAEALAAFESIHVSQRTFTTRLYIAECKQRLGRVREAERELESVVAEAAGEPAMRSTAESDLASLRQHAPKISLRLTPKTVGVSVTLDTEPVAAPSTVIVDPGPHVIVARREGAIVFRKDVLAEADRDVPIDVDAPPLVITAVVAPALPIATADASPSDASKATPPTRTSPTAPSTPPPAIPAAPENRPSALPAYLSLAVGGVFAGTSIFALTKRNDSIASYKESCDRVPLDCDPSLATEARRWEAGAWVSAGAAVVAIGIGTTLLIVRGKDPAGHATTSSLSLGARLGARSMVQLEGRF